MERDETGGTVLTFVCPRSGSNVQHLTDRVSERDDEYEAVTCPACSRLHFLNLKTGKLLGDQKK